AHYKNVINEDKKHLKSKDISTMAGLLSLPDESLLMILRGLHYKDLGVKDLQATEATDGLSEDELDSIEQTLPFKLPLDFRLSYRIHNGQEMSLRDSFKEWLCDYADKLDRGEFFVDREHIFKFYHEPSCLATSHHITVKPTTMYVPSMSRAAPPVNFFAYRIIMEMPSEAPHSQSCRLTTRHWTVTDGNGKVERVTGEGVVGQNPVMKPGSKFAWISCTTFQTDTGSMEGYFMFTNLHTGAEMRVECPRYHMRALPSEDIRLKYAPNPHAQFWPDGIVFEDNLDDESDGENEDEDYMEDYMEAQEELYGIEELDSDDELDFMDPQEAFLDPHYVDLHQDLGDPYEDLVDPHEELEGEDEEVEDENEGENDNIHGNHEVENAENNSVEGGAEEIGGEDEVEDMGDENVQ
ncbi:FBX3-like protein, partial [Mya arenaria]